VYHEARGEPEIGQKAVVHTTLNRTKHRDKSIKEVVLEPYQFSWTLKSKNEWLPNDTDALLNCFVSVVQALNEKDFTGGSMYFHRYDIEPYWKDTYSYVGQYGAHRFYK
jgi:N-acetylmuramoyl-L-alanine amidase